MRLFTSESIYNVKTGQWEERFWVDGIIKDADEYFFEMDREKELEQNKIFNKENEPDPCEGCECKGCCCEENEFDYDDLLDVFVGRILEIGPCRNCLRNLLDEFADIFIPDDEDENEKYIN